MTDLTMYRGDDKTFNLAFTDGNGDAIDITGYTIFFTVKQPFGYEDDTDDSSALIEKNITSHSDPTGGISAVTIDAADTSSLEPKQYVYDMQLKDAGGNILTFTDGAFTIKADVTRRTS